MEQWWSLIHCVFLQSLQEVWSEGVQQYCPALNDVGYLGCKILPFPFNGFHTTAINMPIFPYCSVYCCQSQACCYPTTYCYWFQQLRNKDKTPYSLEQASGNFHNLKYHCFSPLFIYILLQTCSRKVTWSRFFPVSGGNLFILWDERSAHES